MSNEKKIIIVGAGLCGSLLAIRLAQRGFSVQIYEKQADMRTNLSSSGRSINLALSSRGLLALERANLKEAILEKCIPMRGRMIHPLGEERYLSPYSGRSTDFINSVSRQGLNIALLNEADKYNSIQCTFNTAVIDIDLKNASVSYKQFNGDVQYDQGAIVIGTDGAGSVVRQAMNSSNSELKFECTQDFLTHGYKELTIPAGLTGNWQIEKEALHIYPRGEFMIIALPNLDGTFTLTMFHPKGSDIGFDALTTPKKVSSFFKKYFPTLLPYIPDYQSEYFANPVGLLGTVKCFPWQAHGKSLMMGDAAHAIVPFYGQGMNASLEDVKVFDDLVEEYGANWKKVFSYFQDERKENADAIADLAIDNYGEMRDQVNDIPFQRKRKVERQLEQKYSDYYSKYSLVTFRPELPYKLAMMLGRMQDTVLLDMCSRDDFESIPLKDFHKSVMNAIA